MREIIWENTFDISGYGKWGRKCVQTLINSGKYKVRADVLGYRFKHDDPLYQYQYTEVKDPIVVSNTIPTRPPNKIGKAFGFCTCTEQLKPPKNQIQNMNKADFILALSSFCTKNFKAVMDNPEKVHTVNFPMFEGEYSPEGKRLNWSNLNKYKFKFLTVGRIDVRKNITTLINAFKEEFGNSNNVCLILKIYSPDYNVPLWINSHKPTKNIFWFNEDISNMGVLYRSVNAYVCTDLGEAWGGPAQEAMLCGIPSIMPRHSGHLDYANDDNSYLIDVEEDWREIGNREDNVYFDLLPPEGLVKYPVFDDVKRKLRTCYDNFKGFTREEILERDMIENAIKTQELVKEETILKQLDSCFSWVEENV